MTSAKELGVGDIEVKELVEEVREVKNDLIRKIKKLKEEWGERIKRLEERVNEIERELSKLQEKCDNGIGYRFNDREVNKINRMVLEQRMERKDNVVIKGVKLEEPAKRNGYSIL